MQNAINGRERSASHIPAASQPPASTFLADRIVAANGETSEQLQRERFLQLLDVSTSLDDNGEPTIGTDAGSNHTLILIIFKAGLDRFVKSKDPFRDDNREDILTQTLQSLNVIRVALARTPEILFHSSHAGGFSDSLNGVPLFVWLIPRILSLSYSLGSKDEGLKASVLETLTLIIQLEAKSTKNRHYCSSISQYVRDIITEIVLTVEATGPPTDRASLVQEVIISDQHGSFSALLGKLGLAESSFKPFIQLHSTVAALTAACALLNSILVGKAVACSPGMVVRPLVSWCLDTLHQLWQILQVSLDSNFVTDLPIIPFFDNLDLCLRSAVKLGSGSSFVQKSCVLWSDAVCTYLFCAMESTNIPGDVTVQLMEYIRALLSQSPARSNLKDLLVQSLPGKDQLMHSDGNHAVLIKVCSYGSFLT